MRYDETDLIHITVPGSSDDPRVPTHLPEGVVVHHVPALHPDDFTTVNGIPVTSVARTLVDLAEGMSREELREVFATAREKRLLVIDDVRASAARLEWRPSLTMLHAVIDEFAELE